uniref:Sulfate_transp domain-containing protein n=1 Tax=Haemonchus placei TaxID=6290 RepID=A0A0N4WSP9_HAEPC
MFLHHVVTICRLPLPSLPRFSILPQLIKEAIPIAVVTIAVHISMAKLLAKQNNYTIDGKQELYALGFTSTISSFFPVYPSSCSLARTMVNASAGTRTQVDYIFGSHINFIVPPFRCRIFDFFITLYLDYF